MSGPEEVSSPDQAEGEVAGSVGHPAPGAGEPWPAAASGPWALAPEPRPARPATTPPGAEPWAQRPPLPHPAVQAPITFESWRRWSPETEPEDTGPKDEGNPWLVVLAAGMAVLVLIAGAVGLRAAAGDEPIGGQRDQSVRTAPPYPSGLNPSATTPGAAAVPGPGTWSIDTTAPNNLVDDVRGRFQITIPPTWLNVPHTRPDLTEWTPAVRRDNGELLLVGFEFAVFWGSSVGCSLTECSDRTVEALRSTHPGIVPRLHPDSIGGLEATRIEAEFTDVRLVYWVVVQGDRYWVVSLNGPPAQFSAMLASVRPIVTAMSFG